MSALTKVETPLSERYTTTCVRCDHVRQFFGTADEARTSAVTMGWVFRVSTPHPPFFPGQFHFKRELAYCPHCQLLVKEETPS